MDKIIDIKVRNRIAVANPGQCIICGNKDYSVTFDFDDEWSNAGVKTARFYYKDVFIDRVFTGNTVDAPELADISIVKIGVFTENITTTPAIVRCYRSILCDGGNVAPPEEDVYDRLIKMINDLQMNGVTDEQIAEAVENYLTENPIEGGSGESGGYYIPTVDMSGNISWSASDSGMPTVASANIKGPKGDTGPQGPQGEKGADGSKGDKGDTGATGPQGPAGADGSQGPKGDKGDTGATGPAGKDGSDATVTAANIKSALGYTPADAAKLESISDALPSYVITEAETVIDRIVAAQGARTFTFAAITDMHYGNGGYSDGVKHACQALKYIDGRVKLDAVAVLGDYTDGYPSTSLTDAMADYRAVNALLGDLRFAPNMRQMGNHDYYADNIPITRRLVQMYSDDVVWGSRDGGYYHKDFDDYKLRVICPNCNENNAMDTSTNKPTGNISITKAQAQWFADTLASLNAKSDAEEWQVLVITHQPIDWYDSQTGYALANIADAYHEGKSYSNSAVSCDFSGGKNAAKLICNIHGHIHNLLVDKVYKGNASNSAQSNVYRMCTPEACINRANQYDGAWKEATSYPKTTNTADDTSFVIYCIDLDAHTIRAICYGAGYDRTLVYYTETVVYSITQTLTNVNTSNAAINIAQGEAFTTTLSAQSGYELGSITVKMGGVDVTATALSGNVVSIGSVTGNIVITATATLIPAAGYTNLIPLAIGSDGQPYNGGQGWKTGYRLNSSGTETAMDNWEVTGFIPITKTSKIYFANINWDGDGSDKDYATFYTPAFAKIASQQLPNWLSNLTDTSMFGKDNNGNITWVDMAKISKLNFGGVALADKDIAYIRISAYEINNNSVITVDEEIS